ncbi:MAG TPA: hypothetical protein VLA05_10035 [Coriobacteriia bacterium]|nr:hypothetical protein [Coriobacteriia bacterium]
MATETHTGCSERPVSIKPLTLTEVESSGVHLIARPGLRFPVEQIAEGQLVISEPRLRLHVLASDKHELQSSLESAIARLWHESIVVALPTAQPGDWRVRAVLLALFKPF